MRIKIGVMGSASGAITKKSMDLAYRVGKAVAHHNCILINGACDGVPYASTQGAAENDGTVIGISPAKDLDDHVNRYKFPTKGYDAIIYTGFGFKGRNVVNVSNCDAVIIVAGRVGTLNEFTIAYDDGMIIGILEGSGGITSHIRHIMKFVKKDTGAKIVFAKNPHMLVKKLLIEVLKRDKKNGLHKKINR